MSTETVSAPQKPRLNPFAFPSDTDFRFALLIVTVLGVSIFYFMVLTINDIPFIQQRWTNGVTACSYKVYGKSLDQVWVPGYFPQTEAEIALMNEYGACSRAFQNEIALWILGCIILLIGTAALLFWIFPAWKIHRDQLTPLSAEDAPDVVEYLAGLCQEMDLKRHPKFLWNPLNTTSSGLAFGRLGTYYVALSGGLVTQFYTDPSAFRAISLHELAHLKNADVDKTYFATAIWQAFLLLAVLPYVVLDFRTLSMRTFIDLSILTTLVYLIRNSILRAREFYADARANIWAEQNALEGVLASLPHQQGKAWQGLRVHPTPSERRRMLINSDGLFQSNFWVALATGMAFAIMKGNIELLYERMDLSIISQSFVSALFFAFLVVGILGLGVWRNTFAREILGHISIGRARLAFGVTLGILINYFLDQINSTISLFSIFLELFWSGILFCALYVLFHWITSTAQVWLDVAASLRSPRRIYLLNLAAAVVIFTATYAWLSTGHKVIEMVSQPKIIFMMLATLVAGFKHPITSVALTILWAVPLITWFWRKQAIPLNKASWACLESPTRELKTHTQVLPLRPGLAIIAGFLSAILYCGILLAIQTVARLSGVYDVIHNNSFYGSSLIGLAVVMQISVAVIVSVIVKRLGWVHSLLSVFTGGVLMTIGYLTINLLLKIIFGDKIVLFASGGMLDPIYVWGVFSLITNLGAWLALFPTIIASAIVNRVQRNRIGY